MRSVLFSTIGAAALLTAPLPAAAQEARFDLVVYGHDLDAGEHEVFLMTNPSLGGEWESVGKIAPGQGSDGWGAGVIPGLNSDRYLGQDIRENHLTMRIETAPGADGSRISAVYAMPHSPRASAAAEGLARVIAEDPIAVERHSLALHVDPRPAELRPGEAWVELVEAPVRHEPAGVMEVDWLEIIFQAP